MGISVKKIPSINIPFTDSNGRMSPVWYEFLRKFVLSNDTESPGSEGSQTNVIAGAGLTSTLEDNELTLNVAAGAGLAVNANDLSIDIAGQNGIQAALDDEILVNDVSDNNTLRKAQVRNLMSLAAVPPGGSTTHVQYNLAGEFAGDSGFTYDASGGATLSASLTVGGMILKKESASAESIHFASSAGTSAARIQSDANGSFGIYTATSAGNASSLFFSNLNNSMSYSWGSNSVTFNGTGVTFSDQYFLFRAFRAASASTTQTQGQSVLTSEYNNVTTVTNNNDVVTLPTGATAKFCFVRNAGANTLQVYPASGADLGNGTNASTTIKSGSFAVWLGIDGTTWMQIQGTMQNSVVSGLTASTTQTQGQLPLTKDVNQFSTVANANDATTMPSAPAYSRTVIIINNGANTLQIFPASGDNLGAGVNTSVTLTAGSSVKYTNYDATNWVAI